MIWSLHLTGGTFDGGRGEWEAHPSDVLIVWSDEGELTATDDPRHPGIVPRTAEAYRLVECFEDEGRAVYEVGDSAPRRGVVERVGEYIGPRCEPRP